MYTALATIFVHYINWNIKEVPVKILNCSIRSLLRLEIFMGRLLTDVHIHFYSKSDEFLTSHALYGYIDEKIGYEIMKWCLRTGNTVSFIFLIFTTVIFINTRLLPNVPCCIIAFLLLKTRLYRVSHYIYEC